MASLSRVGTNREVVLKLVASTWPWLSNSASSVASVRSRMVLRVRAFRPLALRLSSWVSCSVRRTSSRVRTSRALRDSSRESSSAFSTLTSNQLSMPRWRKSSEKL